MVRCMHWLCVDNCPVHGSVGEVVAQSGRCSAVSIYGKDNVVYHTVIFPGALIGTRDTWSKLHHLSTTEYLTYGGRKFSKSRGIGVFDDSAQETGVPSGIWRYYLIAHRPETSDSEFDWDSEIFSTALSSLSTRATTETLCLTGRSIMSPFDQWKSTVNELPRQYIQEVDTAKMCSGLSTVLHISQ